MSRSYLAMIKTSEICNKVNDFSAKLPHYILISSIEVLPKCIASCSFSEVTVV